MSAPATPTLTLVDVSTRLPSPPREVTISSQRAYIGIDGENFHFLVKGLGYRNVRLHDFVRCITDRLGVPSKKGHVKGVLVSPHRVHYGKGKAIETTGLRLVTVNDFRKEADDGVLRSELNQAHGTDIIVVVSNDLGAYLNVLLHHKKSKKRIVVAGSKVSQCGWALGNNIELEKNGIEFLEISEFIDQFTEKAPEDPAAPPVEMVIEPKTPGPVLVSVDPEPDKTPAAAPPPTTYARPERKKPPLSHIDIFINQTPHETTTDALFVVLEQVSQIFHENLQISTADITGRPEDEVTQISFSTHTRMSRNLFPRILTALRDYSKTKSKVLPGVTMTANHI